MVAVGPGVGAGGTPVVVPVGVVEAQVNTEVSLNPVPQVVQRVGEVHETHPVEQMIFTQIPLLKVYPDKHREQAPVVKDQDAQLAGAVIWLQVLDVTLSTKPDLHALHSFVVVEHLLGAQSVGHTFAWHVP